MFSQDVMDPRHLLLIVGDSTAVGTGAESSDESVVGCLARTLRGSAIQNVAKDGAITADVVQQLDAANGQFFNLVLIQIGGNDALRLKPLNEVRRHIKTVLAKATELGDHVVLLTVGDLGVAPAFPCPLSALFSACARQIRDLFEDQAQAAGAQYLDMYIEDGESDAFTAQPQRFYAGDGLYPSGAGYGVWYDRLSSASPLQRLLTDNQLPPGFEAQPHQAAQGES